MAGPRTLGQEPTQVVLTSSTVSIGAASAAVLAANAGRSFLYVVNTSLTVNIWLGFGADAVVGTGMRLAPGQNLWMDRMGLTMQAVNAIGDAAGPTTLGVAEGA